MTSIPDRPAGAQPEDLLLVMVAGWTLHRRAGETEWTCTACGLEVSTDARRRAVDLYAVLAGRAR